MSLIERFFGQWRAKTRERFDSAVVSAFEFYQRYRTAPASDFIARFTGYTAVCADLNADSVQAVAWRLYRKAKSGRGSRYRGRALSRDQKRWLGAADIPDRYRRAIGDEAEGWEEVPEHPALAVLDDPNPDDSGVEFWHAHQSRLEVCGNSYLYVDENGYDDRPAFFDLQPQRVTVEPGADGLRTYWYRTTDGRQEQFSQDDVIHVRFRKSLFNPWLGVGWLASVVSEHDLRSAMNQHATATFDNRALPDFALITKDKPNKDQVDQIESMIRKRFGGVRNSAKFLVASGIDIKILSTMLKDLEYVAGRQTVERDIMAAAGVPESMLRLNDANLASSVTGHSQYLRQTVTPRVKRHMEFLNEYVLPRIDGTEELMFCYDEFIPQDRVANLTETTGLVGAGIMSINEARPRYRLDPVGDEGDVLRVNGIPLDVLAMPPVAPLPFGGGGSPQEPDEEKPSDSERAALSAEAEAGHTHALGRGGAPFALTESPPLAPVTLTLSAPKEPISQRALWEFPDSLPCGCTHRAADALGNPQWNPAMETASAAFFASQRDDILKTMREKPSGYARARRIIRGAVEDEVKRLLDLWGVTDYAKWNEELTKRLGPIASNETLDAMRKAASQIAALGGAFDPKDIHVENEDARVFIDKQTAEMLDGLDGVNHTTAESIAGALTEAIENKEGLAGMTNRILAVFDAEVEPGVSRSRARARTIARTETGRAQGYGKVAGWAATKVVGGKRWLVSPEPCEFCARAEQQYGNTTIPLEQAFYALGDTIVGTHGGVMVVDFAPVIGATIHPNDICDVIPVLNSEAAP